MSWFSSLAGESAIGLVVAGLLLALVLWLSWRWPTLVFLIALASLAIRPQLFICGRGAANRWIAPLPAGAAICSA